MSKHQIKRGCGECAGCPGTRLTVEPVLRDKIIRTGANEDGGNRII